MQQTEFFCHLGPFFALLPCWQQIIILCITVPEIWCMTDAIVIFHFGLFFALLPTKQPDKRKLKKKKKKSPGDIICIIYTTAPKIMIVCYTVPEICDWYNYFSFWVNYCPFTPNSPKNENSKKMKKTPVDIIMLKSVTKILITCYTVPEI